VAVLLGVLVGVLVVVFVGVGVGVGQGLTAVHSLHELYSVNVAGPL